MASRARKRSLGWVGVALGVLMAASCKRAATPAPATGHTGLTIVVTIPPLMWAVEGLAPQGAEVNLIVPPGASPHGFELTPSQSALIVGADLVVMVGLGMEPQVEAALAAHAADRRRVVRFEDVLRDDEHLDAPHDHDDGHEHVHGGDPHMWLDPVLMGRFVEMLGEEIRSVSGESGRPGDISIRAGAMQGECAAIDSAYREGLARCVSKTIVAQHNAYPYLAHRYGLRVESVIHGAGGGHGGEASPGEIASAVRAIKESGVRAVFVERQMQDGSARRVAEAAGVEVLVLDPLGDGDWPEMMRENLGALVEGLGGSGG
ncbi:MAG: metal ABC transporter substrate-binding protein [Phycisphaerales bacterium]|nr:zinc ABC transporter substrate-binding protein [Phycisphaerales bacterium]